MSRLHVQRQSMRFASLAFWTVMLMLSSCREEPVDGPAVSFEETNSTLTQLPEGQNVAEHDFLFTNIGSEPLEISKVVTQCSCVTTALPKEPIVPGGRGRISAQFKLTATTGPQTTHLLVCSNDARSPITRLSLTASMKVDIATSTDKIDLGWVTIGECAEAEFFVVVPYEPNQEETDIVSFATTSTDVSVDVTGKKRRFNQWDGAIQVIECGMRYVAPTSLGRIVEKIVVKHNTKALQKEIPISVRVVGRVRAEPQSIFLPDLDRAAPIARTITIYAAMGDLPTIKRVARSCQAIEVDSLESAAERYLLHVRILPAKLGTGAVREELRIETDSPEQPTLCIPVLGWRKEGQLQEKRIPQAVPQQQSPESSAESDPASRI